MYDCCEYITFGSSTQTSISANQYVAEETRKRNKCSNVCVQHLFWFESSVEMLF